MHSHGTRMSPVLSSVLMVALSASGALADAAKPTPWLAGVTGTSVYVSLEATDTTTATVDFGLTPAYNMTATTENTQATSGGNSVHNVKLTGLQPNTQYYYRVRQGASVSANYTFWTAPAPGTPARWGFAADSRSNPSSHNTMAALVAGHNPRMMVYGGDLCASATYSSWNSEWFVANQNTLNATAPWVNAAGNHEGWNALTQAFTQGPGGDGSGYYSFDYGDAHIVIVNNMVADGPGSAQWTFVANDLAASTAKWKVVAFHVPAYSSRSQSSDMVAMTQQIFEPNGVDLVLTGHDHFYEHSLVNGIHHMVIASYGVGTRTPGTTPYTIYSEQTKCFGIIETTPETLTLTTYRNDGSVIEIIVIPEPMTLSLLAIGALAILRRRRLARS